jgi:hypothetical protein
VTDQPSKHGHQHLEDGPDPIPTSAAWCRVGFEGVYDFAGGSYPTWDWGAATFTSFITNAAGVFVNDSDAAVLLGPGIFRVSLAVRCSINGQFLDLAPQAGTTRLHPGHLLTEIALAVSGFADLERTHEWTEEAYDLSTGLGLGLGVFREQIGGTIGTTDADTSVFPQLTSYDALIGPNNTGSFPAAAPFYDGAFWLERISAVFA